MTFGILGIGLFNLTNINFPVWTQTVFIVMIVMAIIVYLTLFIRYLVLKIRKIDSNYKQIISSEEQVSALKTQIEYLQIKQYLRFRNDFLSGNFYDKQLPGESLESYEQRKPENQLKNYFKEEYSQVLEYIKMNKKYDEKHLHDNLLEIYKNENII